MSNEIAYHNIVVLFNCFTFSHKYYTTDLVPTDRNKYCSNFDSYHYYYYTN